MLLLGLLFSLPQNVLVRRYPQRHYVYVERQQLHQEGSHAPIQTQTSHYQQPVLLVRAPAQGFKTAFKVKGQYSRTEVEKYRCGDPAEHLYEGTIVFRADAVVEPGAVVIEVLHAAVAGLAVLGVLEDVRFAHVAEILVHLNIKARPIIALGLRHPLLVNGLVRRIDLGGFKGIFDHKNQ